MNTMKDCEHCGDYSPERGAEAEDLRSAIENLIQNSEESDCCYHDNNVIRVEDLQRVLDEVDARDSLAYLESKNVLEKETTS